jgi:adenine phosphoribosyltransferase
MDLACLIRDVPDFPVEGILFKDITTLLQNAQAFKKAVDKLAAQFEQHSVDQVVAIEARGFILGGPIAYKLEAGFVPVRKKGKLPAKTIKAEYSLEYGAATLEMHVDAIRPGDNVLLVDDLLATGGSAKAAIDLVERLGGKVVGAAFLVELEALRGAKKLEDYDVFSLIRF